MSDAQRAARLTDPICHSLGIVGLIGGALLGAAVGAFMILTLPASAPLLAAALVGAAAAGAVGGGALAGEQLLHGLQTAFGLPDPVTGLIGIVGSTNVLIGGLPAVRTVLDMAVPCNGLFSLHHPPIPSLPPAPIAEGSATVLINGQQAARVTSKLVCGAVIQDGCATVLIGGPTRRVLAVNDFEDTLHHFFADVMKVSLWAMAGLTALAGIGPLVVFGLTVGAFYVAQETLGLLGDNLGPGWRDILQGGFGLGAIVVGGKAAQEPRANPLNYRLETEPNMLGSNFGNARLEFTPPETPRAGADQKPAWPSNSPFYEVGFEAQLKKGVDYPSRSDRHHFAESNRQLYEAMQSDPEFAQNMEQNYPGITQGVESGPRGAFPRRAPTSETTWHHVADREGVMQLVPTDQHQAAGPVQESLHPNQRGGMQIWGGGR